MITTLLATVLLSAAPATADTQVHWNPCKYEDGSSQVRCVWDAQTMGNGHGDSFKVRHGGKDRAVYTYISHHRAQVLLNR